MNTFLKNSVFAAGLILLSSPFISCDNNSIKKEKEPIILADNNISSDNDEIKIEVISRKPIVFIAGFDNGNETFYSNARTYFQEKGLKVIDGQYSLEEIILWLNNNSNENPYGEVHIVNQSNPYKGMNLETIVRGEKITSETLRKSITQGTLPTLKDVVNKNTKIVEFNNNSETEENLKPRQVTDDEKNGNQRLTYGGKELILTRHAKCRMDCREISKAEVREVIREGKENKRKSNPNDSRCPTIALEDWTEDGQRVRIIVADCDNVAKLVTVIDLKNNYKCTCK